MLLNRALLFGVALVLAACGGDDTMRDAGADGGPDAGPDAGSDGGRDAGRDGGRGDGGDAGAADPDWRAMNGPPDNCLIERALHPASLLQWAWEPCVGVEGCERAVPSQPGVTFLSAQRAGGHVWVTGAFEDARYQYTFLGSLDGTVVAGWRGPTGQVQSAANTVCAVGPIGVGQSTGAAVIIYFGTDLGRTYLYEASVESLADVEMPIDSVDTGSSPPTALAVSDSLVVGEMSGGAYLLAWSGGENHVLSSPAITGTPLHVRVIGDQAIWEDWGDMPQLAAATFGSPASVYLSVDMAWVSGWATDGSDLAWKQTYLDASGHWTHVDLWTAGYQADPAVLAPHMVARIDSLQPGVVGDGIYAALTGPSRPRGYELYDLSDGRRRTYVPPVSVPGVEDPLYVDSTMLLYRSGTSAEGAFLVRIDPGSLSYDP